MSAPLVSVVVPSFNQGRFIGATVSSVLEQSHREVEVLVHDGQSTDETLSVLRAIDDERLSWVSEADQGQADAINKGLRRARGELLGYLNSDDILLPGAIGSAVTSFARDPAMKACYGDVWVIDEAGARRSELRSEPFDWSRMLTNTQVMLQPGSFWRREVQGAVGLFDTTLHYQLDTDYFLRMALAGVVPSYVPGARAGFRMHGESKTVSQALDFTADWETIVTRLLARDDLPPGIEARRREIVAYMHKNRAEAFFRAGRRREARPHLQALLSGDVAPRHRVLAAAMLVDSYAGTPLTGLLQRAYNRVKEGSKKRYA